MVKCRGHTCKPNPPTCNRSLARVHVVLRSAASVSSARRARKAPKRGGAGAVTCTCACARASLASEEATDATTAGVTGGAIGCTGGGGHARAAAGRLFSCCLSTALERPDFAPLAGLAFARFRGTDAACKRFVAAFDEAPPEARRTERRSKPSSCVGSGNAEAGRGCRGGPGRAGSVQGAACRAGRTGCGEARARLVVRSVRSVVGARELWQHVLRQQPAAGARGEVGDDARLTRLL